MRRRIGKSCEEDLLMNQKERTIRVLLADDDPFITSLYRDVLVRAGVHVETAQNGEEALNKLQRAMPDLLVLDINMPRMDGTQVLRYIREKSSRPDLPVIVLSNVCSEDFVERVNRLRPTQFLIKYDHPPNRVIEAIMNAIKELDDQGNKSSQEVSSAPSEQEPKQESSLPLTQQIDEAENVEAQRKSLLALYESLQPDLRKLGGANPLSMGFQFACATEQCFEQWYAKDSLLPSCIQRLVQSVHTSTQYWAHRVNEGAAAPSLLLVLADDDKKLDQLRKLTERPGWLPITLKHDDSALDILDSNPVVQIVWSARKFSVARKILKKIRDKENVSQVRLIFLLPDKDADSWQSEIYDARTMALPHDASPPEIIAALYGQRRLHPN